MGLRSLCPHVWKQSLDWVITKPLGQCTLLRQQPQAPLITPSRKAQPVSLGVWTPRSFWSEWFLRILMWSHFSSLVSLKWQLFGVTFPDQQTKRNILSHPPAVLIPSIHSFFFFCHCTDHIHPYLSHVLSFNSVSTCVCVPRRAGDCLMPGTVPGVPYVFIKYMNE